LKQLGNEARGIAVIDRGFSQQQLDELAAAGVRVVRLNLETGKGRDTREAARRLCEIVQQIAGRRWLIQLWTALPVIAALAAQILDQPNEIIIDHFGLAHAAGGVEQDGFPALLSLLRAGKAYIKLSAPFMIAATADYSDIVPIAKALIEAAPDRVIWGSNWPHTSGAARRANAQPNDLEPFRREDDGYNLGLVKDWTQDAGVRRLLLCENPARLFGFDH
jgi:predicted TIM-barrel fold metal-dependent hydrolase